MIRFVGQQEQKNKILGSFNDEDWVVMEGEKELSITKSLKQQKIMGNKTVSSISVWERRKVVAVTVVTG